ncbi:MAG: FAD-dependent thymidylate synthase [Proteobacteria bacterium]|nr:FAD-dependent thymidylate synthase [Pseudomonadota bacterium]MBU1233345.1 FAD-dependent thymidylate synthase [Pseudomonadota bacterium]MBU1417862.1 FAD-dependent thymidylate synthase [Pseudomonadota bacterium]MBU1453384.1 FAD-dependent thymidylate synthase [Pseudomonadota bacterium]
MLVVDPSYEIQDELDQTSLVIRLEACGRICYKSEEKITKDSALPFVKKIAEHGHNSVMEMAVVTLGVQCSREQADAFLLLEPKYLFIDRVDGEMLVTGSIRSFRELYQRAGNTVPVHAMVSFLVDGHPYLFEGVWDGGHGLSEGSNIEVRKLDLQEVEALPPHLLARHRFSGVKFVVNRAVTHEIVRHRPCSFLQESQRYCRYSQDKFGSQVTFIKPMFYEEGTKEYLLWQKAMEDTEQIYLQLLETSTPQAARTVLPNSCKTEIIVYCNLAEWRHIFTLRTSPAAEPSMREVMIPLAAEMKERYPAVFP